MNILSNMFNIQPTTHVKSLSKALFSFLLIASFLASCTTDDTTSIIAASNLTLDDCPEDSLTPDAGTAFTWTNPTGDIIITSIVITADEGTTADDIPTLETNSTSATLPTAGDYTVTITAASTDDTSVTATCSFAVNVTSDDTPTLSACPDNITNGEVDALVEWTAPATTNLPDGASLVITTTTGNITDASLTGATFLTAGTYTATFQVEDASGEVIMVSGSELSCSFEITVSVAGVPVFDTCSTIPTTTDLIIPFDQSEINVEWSLPTTSVISRPTETAMLAVAFTAGTDTAPTIDTTTTNANFSAGSYTITYTATANNIEASCVIVFTVTATPIPSLTCPPTNINAVVNVAVTWTPSPTIENSPAGATIDVSATSANSASATDLTLTSATFTATGIYTILFAAMDNGETITVSETALTCTLTVTVDDMQRPIGSRFFLLSNNAVPSTENPFLIHDTNDLAMLATVINGNVMYSNINMGTPDNVQSNYRQAAYQLASDITLSGTANNFTPIGTGKTETVNNVLTTTCDGTCFEGTFNGSNNTISGLYFNNSGRNNLGLFAVISGEDASISNLILTGVNITGNSNVGGLVGTMLESSSISHVSASGSVNGERYTGGLVGRMESMSSMANASASSAVNARTSLGGGLVGFMENSHMTNVFASGQVAGPQSLGGLVGQVTTSSIINAYASGAVSTDTRGLLNGGLVGILNGSSSLINTLAWGDVLGSSGIGGLVARASGNDYTITASYWKINPAGVPMGCGSGTCPANAGRTSNALQTPEAAGINTGDLYFGWDGTSFTVGTETVTLDEAPWDFGANNQYPRLNASPVSVACQRTPSGDDCPNSP